MVFAFFCLISAQLFVMILSMFFTTQACLFQVVTICIQWRSASSETKAEDESCWFRPPKSVQEEEESLFVQSNFKSTKCKDKWAVEVSRT